MKKILSIFILIFTILLTSCQVEVGENQLRLPNLNGKSRVQIEQILDKLEIEYIFYIENEKVTTQYDKFIRYGNGYTAGAVVDKGTFIRIYTTPLHLTYKVSQNVKLDVDYTGKSFINDGIGEVKLVRPVDGDTARFRDPIAGVEFSLRYLGIDTPESTRQKDPWGKAASDYSKQRLNAATTIVLEAEGSRNDLYGRYLGWVWLDGELYNLQVVEEAYSNATCGGDSKYSEYMLDVDAHVQQTGRRFFGEIDPNYDYENKKFLS